MCKQHVNPAELLTARLLLLNIDLQHRRGKNAPLEAPDLRGGSLPVSGRLVELQVFL